MKKQKVDLMNPDALDKLMSVKWDGVERVNELNKYFKLVDNQPFSTALREFMTKVIKSVLLPDYINDTMFILKGGQAIGKSHFLRWLMPVDELYFEEYIAPNNKYSMLALSKHLIINIDELDVITKYEAHSLPKIISKLIVNHRVAFAPIPLAYKRTASFVGATINNEIPFLTESPSMFKVIDLDSINWDYSKEIIPLQLWAQIIWEVKSDVKSLVNNGQYFWGVFNPVSTGKIEVFKKTLDYISRAGDEEWYNPNEVEFISLIEMP